MHVDLLLGYVIMFGGVDSICHYKLWDNFFGRISHENKGSFLEKEITAGADDGHKKLIKFIKNVVPYMDQSTYLLNTAVTYALSKGIIITSAFFVMNNSYINSSLFRSEFNLDAMSTVVLALWCKFITPRFIILFECEIN